MKKIVIYITVFLCGAIIMALELVAARVLSPYVGSSNPIWTSIIGVILISMSLGYWLGGKLADRKNDFNTLSSLIIISAVLVSIVPVLETYFIKPLSLTDLPLSIVAISSALMAFALPSALLATVSPYAIKLMEVSGENVGSISGRLSAISTLGSIFGTFFTGFCLIPFLGNKMIILLSAILLGVLAILLFEKKKKEHFVILIICISFSVGNFLLGQALFKVDNPNILADLDSEYSRIWVNKLGEYKVLQVDRATESYLKTDGSMGSYLNYYDLFDAYIKDAKDTLIIGGAAYTYPMHFLDKYSDKNIDVVEIDPMMTDVAKEYFGLTESNRLGIYHQDGRSFINKNIKKYDAIFVDAFHGHNVPFELTTVEAYQEMKKSLKDNGMVMVNVISSLEGEKSGFIQHEFATFKEVFNEVKLFDVENSSNIRNDEIRNLILVGFNYDEPVVNNSGYEDLLNTEVNGYYSDEFAFTDDYAPVESYVL